MTTIKKIQTVFFVSAFLWIAQSAQALICPPQYEDDMVSPMFTASKEAHNAAIESMDETLGQTLSDGKDQVVSAVAVLTKQKALAANQIADAMRVSHQQVATSLQAMAVNDRVKKAQMKYSAEFGQGYDPCKVLSTRTNIMTRMEDMRDERTGRVATEVRAASGKFAKPTEAQKDAIEENKPFCTQDQVDSGLCERVGQYQGASANAGTLFAPAAEGEDLYAAKVAFVNNIIGLPDGEISPDVGKTPLGAEYMMAKAKKDARLSVATTILKQIQLEHSSVTGAHTGQDLPLAEHFDNEVKRYSGDSDDYLDWSTSLAAQDQRGVLVEILKVKALDLALQHRQYEQVSQMEAALASLVASEADVLNTKTRMEAESAMKGQVKQSFGQQP
jgi:hypothetical protein